MGSGYCNILDELASNMKAVRNHLNNIKPLIVKLAELAVRQHEFNLLGIHILIILEHLKKLEDCLSTIEEQIDEIDFAIHLFKGDKNE